MSLARYHFSTPHKVGTVRVELTTYRSSDGCTTSVLRAREIGHVMSGSGSWSWDFMVGRGGGTRTPDARCVGPTFWPLNYAPARQCAAVRQRGVGGTTTSWKAGRDSNPRDPDLQSGA